MFNLIFNHMKKLNHLLFACLALLVFSCVENQEEEFLLEGENKAIPAGSREVKINLDSKYDLTNTVAYSMYDTMAMNVKNRTLAVPHGASDMVLFVEKNSDKVLAVVAVGSNDTQLTLNAETVSAALLDIIPEYASLSVEERQNFAQTASSTPAFRSMVSTVDRLLSSKQGIYSTDSELVANIRAMNSLIAKSYADQNSTGDASHRVSQDMRHWITSGESPKINNRSFAYVEARFTPNRDDKGKETHSYILNPRPISPDQYSITDTDVPDGYYTLALTQKSSAARQANQMALANNLLFLSVGEYFNMLQMQGAAPCANYMIDEMYSELDEAFASPPQNMMAAYLQALAIAASLTEELLESPKCAQFIQNNEAVIAMMAQRALLLAAILDGPTLLQEGAGFMFLMEALYLPFEFQENLMIHHGNVVPGQLRFEMVGSSYDKDYPRNAYLDPEVRAVVLCYYDDIDFTIFAVEWETRYANNGTVSESRTYFDSYGIATTRWTLPNRRTDNYLNAFVRNAEGYDLMGSPMCFVVSTRNL